MWLLTQLLQQEKQTKGRLFAFMQLHNTYNYAVIKKLKSMLETSNKELNITSLVGRCQYVLYHQNVGDYCSSDTY